MEEFVYEVSQQLRRRALAFPDTSEGTSCVNRAFKVRKKNFLFVGEREGNVRVMVKLPQSGEQAAALADPRIEVGKTGWATLNFAPGDPPDLEMLGAWVEESFRAMAPKAVLRAMDG